jgi:hypothetical protein
LRSDELLLCRSPLNLANLSSLEISDEGWILPGHLHPSLLGNLDDKKRCYFQKQEPLGARLLKILNSGGTLTSA